MGILTDYVALSPDVARDVDAGTFDAAAYGDWALQSKGIFDVELATLEEILTGTDFSDIIGEASDVLSEAGDHSMVFSAVRPALTEVLAQGAGTLDWAAVADRWAATDELAGADVDDLATFLLALADLAARAVADQRALYLWTCL